MLGVSGAVLLGLILWQAAEAPDIAGTWTGDDWGIVSLELKRPGQYEGRYAAIDAARSGTLQLRWSRVELRFNGAWQEGDDRSGRISLRLVGDEIRGALTTRQGGEAGTPRLGDLLWVRPSGEPTGEDGRSLVAAVRQFNLSTDEVRRELFSPPIPDLTVERLREGFKQSAQLYRREGKTQVADALQRIAESGRLPDYASQLIGSGVHGRDENGETISRQVVPALTLPDDSVPGGHLLVVLRQLELIYRKDGPVSKDYGDQFNGETGRMADAGAALRSIATQPNATTTAPQLAWGEGDGGVRIRASTGQRQWPSDEPVELIVDLNNETGGPLAMYRIPYCEVEIDGAWFVPAPTERLVPGSYLVGQGIHERVAVFRLVRNEWVLKSAVKGDISTDARAFHRALLLASADPANQLRLAPGRHTVRIAREVDKFVGDAAQRAQRPVSQAVEIEVIAVGKETPAVGVDPMGAVAPEASSRFLTAEQAVEQGMILYNSRKRVIVRFRVGTIKPRTVLDENGKPSVWWHLYAESAPDFSASLSPQAQAALGESGIAEAERRFTGKLVDVTGTVTGVGLDLVSRPDTIWTYQIDVTSLDQIRLVDAANAGGEPGAAESGQPDESRPTVETPGIRVELLLSVATHSRELMNRNVGFDGLSLMGTAVNGTIDGKEHDNIVAVLAHHCRLESFAEGESAGRRYWRATFFVPQGPTSDGSNRSLSQERLDAMQAVGVQFALDHTRDPAPSAPDRPDSKVEPNAPTRLNDFTTGHGITVACSADGGLIAVANGNPTRILQVGGTSRVKGHWKPTADILDGAGRPAGDRKR